MDYVLGPYTVRFMAGAIHASMFVTLVDDDVFEINESFYLMINPSSLPKNVVTDNPKQATVTIVDNDGK